MKSSYYEYITLCDYSLCIIVFFSGIKIKPMSSTNLLEGDTIKLKCSVKLKSSNQLHLFAKNRGGPFANKVRLQFVTINSVFDFPCNLMPKMFKCFKIIFYLFNIIG